VTEPELTFGWRRTGAPVASARTDDICFLDADRGWAVNSNGQILHTEDGAVTWTRQFSVRGAYLRCVGFANDRVGWVGTLAATRRLFATVDGGATWTGVESLPPDAPPAICGLSVVNGRVVYGSGTNFPNRPAGVVKTIDGGATWTAVDMSAHATLLVDIHFQDELRGWVVGGKADVPNPRRDDVVPVVLSTDDGGLTWQNRLAGIQPALPMGEWGWKIHFVDENVGFVSLENFHDGAVLKTVDGGHTWARMPVNDPQGNANLEGVGFADPQLGWVGGWGNRDGSDGFTSETRDGGVTWADANEVGKLLNRFRVIREPDLVVYASGDTVYKYSALADAANADGGDETNDDAVDVSKGRFPLAIPVVAPPDAKSLRVDIWDRFGEHLATMLNDDAPAAGGARRFTWSGEISSGGSAEPGAYIYRVTIDDHAESRVVAIEA